MAIAASHSMAIGTVPANPPTGYIKIFIDNSGLVKTLTSDGTVYVVGGTATGDMEATVYDPQNIQGDAFDLSVHTGAISAASQVTEDSLHRFVTDSQITSWDNKEPAFAKFSAFNRDFAGTGQATTVARSDHDHDTDYEPLMVPTVDDQLKVYDSNVDITFENKPVDPYDLPVLHVQDQKSQNVAGGTFTSGARRTRELNSIEINNITGASVTANVISLPAGDYEIRAEVPCCAVGKVQAWLYNVTATTDILRSTSVDTGNTAITLYNYLFGQFSLSEQSSLEIQHRCETSGAGDGFGLPANFDTEVYTNVVIKKLIGQ